MIITRDPHMRFVAEDDKGHKQIVYNDETYGHNYPFTFECPFSDQAVPQTNTVVLINLTKQHRAFYKKGMHCWVDFNWGKEPKKIAEGFINGDSKFNSDGVTDQTTITFTEGTNYSNVKARAMRIKKTKKVNHYKTITVTEKGHFEEKRVSAPFIETYKRGPKKGQKHVVHHWQKKKVWVKPKTKKKRVKTRAQKAYFANITFRKGTSYKKIIQSVAAQAGIKIDKLDLTKNDTIKKSYTAKGKPLALLKYWAKRAKSEMTYERGKLVIINPNAPKHTWYKIDDKDLMQVPAENEASDDKKGAVTWEIVTPLIPDVTTNTGIIMNSKYLKGKFYCKGGSHTFDGESPKTQVSLVKIKR